MYRESLNTTLKAVALIKLVEAGMITQEPDGSVNTDDFDRFWAKFEPNIETWFWNERDESHENEGYALKCGTLRDLAFFSLGFVLALYMAFF